MIGSPDLTSAEVAAEFGVYRTTLYRALRKAAAKEKEKTS
jgi:hypothetical protein